ncbi:GNAT family N-acetyltransferase [Xenorhabdus sp. PB61.4]|uniref:GNAT family N-acetyltransferase n=1 Tax=Xenorhabdus sp. PB61.4 TaxID=2788940 RepID=UPI001E2B38DA|nr:GNAT family N-acetyltransferase [Xenorhabdus sp. PB61.4]MCC8366947.1 GNAT family N-acetyltransferase [Xenorhabdus sp. PB61.4]
MEISCKWVESVSHFSREDWEHCYDPENVITSYSLQLALERSELVESFYYLSLYRNEKLTAIISCFSMYYSLTDLASPKWQDWVATLRKIFPGFLKPRIFVVGSPIATCSHMLGISLPPDHPDYPRLLQAMELEIDRKVSELQIKLQCIKEFDGYVHQCLQQVLQSKFVVCRSPDTTYVYTDQVGGLEYINNMLKRYRNVLRRRKRKFDATGLRWIMVDDFSAYVDKLNSLYRNVLQRSHTKFECLTPEFFHAVNEELGDQAQVLLCLDDDYIVAFELFLKGKNLHPLYLGIDYSYRDASALYFNCLYRVIEEAQNQQYPYIELGQTSYDAKFSVGAISSKLYFYIKHSNALYNFLLYRFRKLIFPAPKIPEQRKVFKLNEDYIDALKSSGALKHVD